MLRATALAGLTLCVHGAFSQTAPPPERPEFEVASIKLNKSADGRIMIRPAPGGRFTATGIPMRFLITEAYRIKDFQLSGAPSWLLSERYDIEAKADGNPSFDTMRVMLQTLLEDRLKLKYHHETKEMAVYNLVVAKPGKLHEAEGDCGPRPQGLPPPLEPGKMPSPPCGGMFMFPGHISGQKVPMSQLVDILSRFSGRIVIDQTNLTAKYDIDLQYTPDPGQFPGPPPGGGPPGAPPLPPVDPNGPSLFTALQEQLGLKLESQKGQVEMIVIDHVERPSEN
ncbi:MAG TPA: TIGR03435 family protein [Bryobacteraceae bacterium]|nr:TIGR03435 family protein [Bryobacteraceae bacterium]